MFVKVVKLEVIIITKSWIHIDNMCECLETYVQENN